MFSAAKITFCILRYHTFHCCPHNIRSFVFTSARSIQSTASHSTRFKIHFNIIHHLGLGLPARPPSPSHVPTKTLYAFLLSHACHMPQPSHPFDSVPPVTFVTLCTVNRSDNETKSAEIGRRIKTGIVIAECVIYRVQGKTVQNSVADKHRKGKRE